ncbi:MAG: hypothetical protein ABII25_01320 [bacterium]
MIPTLIIFPTICTALVAFFGERNKFARNFFVMLPAVVLFVIIAKLAPSVLGGERFFFEFLNWPPFLIRFDSG